MARYNFLSRGLKTLVAGAAICTSLLSATAAQAANYDIWKEVQERGTLRCGAAVAAPYVMKDVISGDYSGFFVELCKDFGEKVLNVEVEFVDTSWENLVAGIQSKKWDLGMAIKHSYRQLGYAVEEVVDGMVRSGEMAQLFKRYGLTYELPGLYQDVE